MLVQSTTDNTEFKSLKTYPKIDKWDKKILETITSIPRIRQSIVLDRTAGKDTFMSFAEKSHLDYYDLAGNKIDTVAYRFKFKSGLDGINGCNIDMTCSAQSTRDVIDLLVNALKKEEIHDINPPQNPIKTLESLSGKIVDYIGEVLK